MPSFDVVSEVDRQEVRNAVDQAQREIANRFDFKNTDTTIAWRGENGIEITSSTQERCSAALDVLKDKLVKRKVSLKALDADPACARAYLMSARIAMQRGDYDAAVAQLLSVERQVPVFAGSFYEAIR